MSLGQDLVVWPPGLVAGDLESYYDDRASSGGAVGGLNSLPGGIDAMGVALGGQAAGVFEMGSSGGQGALHHHPQHQQVPDRQPSTGPGAVHDPQLVNESYAQAYVAAVSLAARLQPSQFAIGDDISADADMADLPEVLDLHQPALSHRGSMSCSQDTADGTGSLVLVPSCTQDQASALQTAAVLPVLHLDKNALLDFLQAPQPPEHRSPGQRCFDSAQGSSSHSAPYGSPPGCSSQSSLAPYGLESYNYSSIPIMASPPGNSHHSGNINANNGSVSGGNPNGVHIGQASSGHHESGTVTSGPHGLQPGHHNHLVHSSTSNASNGLQLGSSTATSATPSPAAPPSAPGGHLPHHSAGHTLNVGSSQHGVHHHHHHHHHSGHHQAHHLPSSTASSAGAGSHTGSAVSNATVGGAGHLTVSSSNHSIHSIGQQAGPNACLGQHGHSQTAGSSQHSTQPNQNQQLSQHQHGHQVDQEQQHLSQQHVPQQPQHFQHSSVQGIGGGGAAIPNGNGLAAINGNAHQNQNYPINHKQMLAQKYAAEELQNSAFSQMMVHGGGLGMGGLGMGIGGSSGLGLMGSSASAGSSPGSSTSGSGNGLMVSSGNGPAIGGLQLDCGGIDPSGLLHPQLYICSVDPMQAMLCKDDSPTDLLEGTIVGVDLSLSKSHANTSLCPQNRIPSQIVNQRQDGVLRPPKKDRANLQNNRRSPLPKENCQGTFCDECGLIYEKECSLHRVILIEDERVQTRAFASLPSNHLTIQNISSNPNSGPVLGVFSKLLIPRRTMFGPMEGVPVKTTQKPNVPFPIILSEDATGYVVLETADEDQSNWMRFVRTAATATEQNMAVVQQGGQIFFRATTQILPKTELKVWYSDSYAQRYRLMQDFYECFDCGRLFATTDILLQHMVNEHSDTQHLSGLSSSMGHPAGGVQDANQLGPYRKPKMARYPSGGQWTDCQGSRQQQQANGSNQTGTSTILAPNLNETTNSSSLYMMDPLVDNMTMSRRSKRGQAMPVASCSHELMAYNPDKALDAVEIIEHITQTMGPDCGANLQNDLLAGTDSNANAAGGPTGYDCIDSQEQLATDAHPTAGPEQGPLGHQGQQATSSRNGEEFFGNGRCAFPQAGAVQVTQAHIQGPAVDHAVADATAVLNDAGGSDRICADKRDCGSVSAGDVDREAVRGMQTAESTESVESEKASVPYKKKRSPDRRFDVRPGPFSGRETFQETGEDPQKSGPSTPMVVASKISKFLQRRNEQMANRSMEGLEEQGGSAILGDAADDDDDVDGMDEEAEGEVDDDDEDCDEEDEVNFSSQSISAGSSCASDDESTTDSSAAGSSVAEENVRPPLPQQKRFIKNIKNKHYVRADSNHSSIDNVESPGPSEGRVATLSDAQAASAGADARHEQLAANAATEDPKGRSTGQRTSFMTPLKKKLPKSLIEDDPFSAGPAVGKKAKTANAAEVQSAEITSVGCELAEAQFASSPDEGQGSGLDKRDTDDSVASGGDAEVKALEAEPQAKKRDDKKKRPAYDCLVCDKSFPHLTMLKLHSRQHQTAEGFRCPKCPRQVADFFNLRRHIRLYHIYPTTKSYRCETCGKTFCQTDKFQRHVRVHEGGDKKFKCDICGKILSRKDKLADHIRNLHSEEGGSGEVGKKSANVDETQRAEAPRKAVADSTQPSLATPEKCRLKREGAGLQVRSFHCDLCGKGFRKRGMLAQHYTKLHPELPPESTFLDEQFDKVISEFPCPYCDKSYKSSTKRKQHIEQNHPKAEVPHSYKTLAASIRVSYVRCPWCPSKYTIRCKLYAHQRSKHQKLLNILNLTGITEESWEKVDLAKKAACMKIQAAIEAQLLKCKENQALGGAGAPPDKTSCEESTAETQTKPVNRVAGSGGKNRKLQKSRLKGIKVSSPLRDSMGSGP